MQTLVNHYVETRAWVPAEVVARRAGIDEAPTSTVLNLAARGSGARRLVSVRRHDTGTYYAPSRALLVNMLRQSIQAWTVSDAEAAPRN